LILLVDPDKESFVFVMENTSSVRPVSIQTYSFEESVALLEKEMILDELLSLLFSQLVERIIGTS